MRLLENSGKTLDCERTVGEGAQWKNSETNSNSETNNNSEKHRNNISFNLLLIS